VSDTAETQAEGETVPRTEIPLENKVEYLSVLSETGELDSALEPDYVPEKDLQKLYKTMLLTRMLDERCLHMQRQGRIGTYGPCTGQEATPLAAAYWLRKDDWFVPSYRELSGYLWRGWSIGQYLLWWGGHEIGSAVPPGINDLPICVPIGSQMQYAMGIAWGCKLKQNGAVCVAFCGDGGTSQGDFHEALNFATVYKVPLVAIVQNNGWAISLPRAKQTASPTIAQKAIAYGMNGVQVDGNDMLALLVATGEAIERARKGAGPQFIEAVTYRLRMHTTADDPKKYRSEEEVKQWEARDPLPRFRKYLERRKLLDEKIHTEMERQIREELERAIVEYEAYQLNPYEFFNYMYAEKTPELIAQEQELRAYLGNGSAADAAAAPISRVM
jgi:pyruvate dehydrogenase E1 component alpha subunit